jgi:hypothetical protein
MYLLLVPNSINEYYNPLTELPGNKPRVELLSYMIAPVAISFSINSLQFGKQSIRDSSVECKEKEPVYTHALQGAKC